MGTEIYARGTLGDALIILLKIINTDITKVNHYSKHARVYPLIEKIYSLKPDLKVEFLDDPGPHTYIKGGIEDYETYVPHPQFVLPRIDQYNLPTEYNVVQLKAGINDGPRTLRRHDVETVDQSLPVVLLGTDEGNRELFESPDVVDLRNKSSLLASFAVLASAKAFYGPQGLLAFFALSQRVKTSIFLKSSCDVAAVNVRINKIKEWKNDVYYL